jgi:uncharacterized protein YndB with AHSA1/START domain
VVTENLDGPPARDDRRGTVGVGKDGGWQVRFERRLPHSPEQVWASLVDVDQQDRWVPGVRIHARVGGPVVFDFGDEGRAEGEVLVAEPPRVLEHTWLWPDELPSTVRWEITPDGDGSLLVLLHRPVRPEPAVDYCTGWHVMLDALAVHLDGGDPGAEEPDFGALYETYTAAAPRS